MNKPQYLVFLEGVVYQDTLSPVIARRVARKLKANGYTRVGIIKVTPTLFGHYRTQYQF